MPNSITFAKVNTDGESSRIRRNHVKSKNGCDPCKKRRIKCDEQLPRCNACKRKKLVCTRVNIPQKTPPNTGKRVGNPNSRAQMDINILQMRLLHFFDKNTADTLIPVSSWQQLIPIAFKYEFLLHAILMMSAAHLYYQEPWNEEYREAEIFHLSRATKGLRSALSIEPDDEYAQALFACALLLYNQAWSSKQEVGDETISEELEMDFFIPLGTGLKDVILSITVWPKIWRSPIFGEAIIFSPKIPLTICAEATDYPEQLKRVFQAEYHSIHGLRNSERHFVICMSEFGRLIPAISVVKLHKTGVDTNSLDAALVRYFYSWPVLLSKEFIEMIKCEDTVSSLILYHYYSSIVAGVSDKYWWAQNRPKQALKRVIKSLEGKGVFPIDMLSDLSSTVEFSLDINTLEPSN